MVFGNDGSISQEKSTGMMEVLKKVFSPPLLGFMLAILLVLLW